MPSFYHIDYPFSWEDRDAMRPIMLEAYVLIGCAGVRTNFIREDADPLRVGEKRLTWRQVRRSSRLHTGNRQRSMSELEARSTAPTPQERFRCTLGCGSPVPTGYSAAGARCASAPTQPNTTLRSPTMPATTRNVRRNIGPSSASRAQGSNRGEGRLGRTRQADGTARRRRMSIPHQYWEEHRLERPSKPWRL